MPLDLSSMFMLWTIQFTQKKGYKEDYRQIASPFIHI